jgi:hypothetical protein
MKHSLALMEVSSSDAAFVCHRIAYNQSQWNLTVLLKVISGSLHFLFAEDFCPAALANTSVATWDGIRVLLQRQSPNEIAVFALSSGNGVEHVTDPICSMRTQSLNDFVHVNLVQNESVISISAENSTCAGAFNPIRNGYLTFIGFAAESGEGRQELGEFRIEPAHISQSIVKSENSQNRKLFKGTFGKKYQEKPSSMLASQIHVGDTLNASDSSTMSRANTELIFRLLSEVTERAKLGLDFQTLRAMIDVAATIHFLKAEKKILRRKDTLNEVGQGIDQLMEFLENHLNVITDSIWIQTNATVDGIGGILSNLSMSFERAEILAQRSEKSKQRLKHRGFEFVIAVICGIEFVCFCIFIAVRRHQTRNFKRD